MCPLLLFYIIDNIDYVDMAIFVSHKCSVHHSVDDFITYKEHLNIWQNCQILLNFPRLVLSTLYMKPCTTVMCAQAHRYCPCSLLKLQAKNLQS